MKDKVQLEIFFESISSIRPSGKTLTWGPTRELNISNV